MRPSLASFLLTVAFTVHLASADSLEEATDTTQPCSVRAWVRAEDLSPNHVSRGELRIKVLRQECANQIASVALRLQLDEFGEVKHLKRGAVLPEVRPANESASTEYSSWMGSDVVYDYQAHDDGLSDPELWTLKAEERRSWTTEVILLRNPDISDAIVTPFTVAVPPVNYPAVVSKYRNLHGPIAQYSFSDLGYRYTTIVTFTDGRIEKTPSGHTAFIPSSEKHIQSPFTWNLTFEESKCEKCDAPSDNKQAELLEKCLPKDQRSAFTAEVTVDSGKVATAGQSLKGLVTVHTTTHGTTIPSDVYVYVEPVFRDHWAHAHAASAGDSACPSAWSGLCDQPSVKDQVYSKSEKHSNVFAENDDEKVWQYPSYSSGDEAAITSSNPRTTFEFRLPPEAPVDIMSYYSGVENLLHVELTVLYPLDVAKCMYPGQKLEFPENEHDPAAIEEGLWDTWTRLGTSAGSEDSKLHRKMTLHATVPITVVGPEASDQSFAHYLEPDGAVTPLLRSGLQMDMPASFPAAKPLVTVEAMANTSARLMRPGSTDPIQFMQSFMNRSRYSYEYPDPTKHYQHGNYVGLLWRKKVVAEERGIWPPRNEEILEEPERQRPLTVAP
ncbi:hypothetical protein R3P38DRAFT_2530267 [Favolaschia claudopus]|uniref:Uncharacterized protein n=1 Tax=Favolaschia claudopus TaxID=2862362 RepID=A0AAW0BG37_9AGAR